MTVKDLRIFVMDFGYKAVWVLLGKITSNRSTSLADWKLRADSLARIQYFKIAGWIYNINKASNVINMIHWRYESLILIINTTTLESPYETIP